MNRPTELVPISEIKVADRLREDYGDIAGLADSIATHGLLHPLTIDDDNTLIAGERRLRAMKRLDFLEVECRRWDGLTETERRELELEENLRRKDLTSYERSKNVVELATVAEEAIAETLSTESVESPRMGRPPKSRVPEDAISERIATPKQTMRDAKKHVAAAERYPMLQRPEWNQSKALEVERTLNTVPEEDRPGVAALVDEPGIPADRAISMIRNVASKPSEERKQILTLAASDDARDRSLAKTKAAEAPPMPDPRRALLKDALSAINKAIRMFPNDPEVPELESIHEQIVAVRESIRSDRHGLSFNAAD